MDEVYDPDRSMYGIPNTIGQIESNSALVTQLKNLLENALERENHLADFIERLCKDHLSFLSKKFENLTIADAKIREDAERLRMRNEELETRLLSSQSKLWDLKLMYDEYDKIIEKMMNQKEENTYIHKENKNEIMSTVDEFLSKHGIPRKKGRSAKTRSALSSQRSGKSSLKKKQSVRFQRHHSRSGDSDQMSQTFGPRSQTSLLSKPSSRGNKVSLRKKRSEMIRLNDLESHGGTPSQRSTIIRNNLQANLRNQRNPPRMGNSGNEEEKSNHPDMRSQGIQPSTRRSASKRSAGIQPSDPRTPSVAHVGIGGSSPRRPPTGSRSVSQRQVNLRSRNNESMSKSQSERINNDPGDYDENRIPEHENEDDLYENDQLDNLVFEDEYSEEGEEDEEEDDENLEVHTIFDEANDYIESLKRKLKETENKNDENDQNIQSLRNEISELQKINDNLENQLYKYQYDLNRVTDVLMNDAHPTKEELEEEEKGIEDMSEQERNLYNLLKKAADLRETQTLSKEKISVFEKDIDELMNKNAHLQEVEQIKNEISAALEHEKQRASDLEAMWAEKTQAFQTVIEEKENLLNNMNTIQLEKDNLWNDVSKIQAEKDELKGTLDTLHQLRDQEEEEIEKTLDEAKSIIQKLEEKLHNKDDKIKRYKDKISGLEREKTESDNRLMAIEDEFKDKEK